jgi:hypothetical protein
MRSNSLDNLGKAHPCRRGIRGVGARVRTKRVDFLSFQGLGNSPRAWVGRCHMSIVHGARKGLATEQAVRDVAQCLGKSCCHWCDESRARAFDAIRGFREPLRCLIVMCTIVRFRIRGSGGRAVSGSPWG